ncbi:hypothetical protein PINS_up007141 [Pythium insidiosum]|nr:hypothetical protein PINS_up007141 [Pythium insidiosum]
MCGIDHHALYFPIPQARRMNFSRREDVVPWRLFPGMLQFDLCLSLTGEARSVADLIIASGCIPLRDCRTQADSTHEMIVPLTVKFAPGNGGIHIQSDWKNTQAESGDTDELHVRVELRAPETRSGIERRMSDDAASTAVREKRSSRLATPSERTYSEFVCESLVEKEKQTVIGQHIFDAFAKVKGTIKGLQNEIGQACGTVARVENLFNWTHPWKSGLVFVAVVCGTIVMSLIPGRWIVLMAGLTEFGAVFMEDRAPSNRLRQFLWTLLSSLPTDQDLVDAYDMERESHMRQKQAEKEKEATRAVLLRHHALWAGIVQSKGENERAFKSFFLVYRPYRFVLWKSAEDAEQGTPPLMQLLFERMESIIHSHKIDEKSFILHVFGTTSAGADEKRSFAFETEAQKDELLDVIRRSCDVL